MTDRSSIHLLLIEDNPGDARLVREHLADVHGAQDFHLQIAPTLAAAIEQVAHLPEPGIALLDLSLPDSHGLETLARWQAAAPTLPVIVLTGSDDEALAVAAVREGAQDYLVKGRIDGGLLAQAVRYAIERKLVQVALREAKESLERRVEERTAELRESNGRLQNEIAERTLAQHQAAELLKREQETRQLVENANRNKDEFLAILSHELRTPLNAILGWAEILRTGGEPTRAEVREGMEVIERNARAQARLVEDVLEVSRIICGKVRLNLSPVDLSAVIDAALTSARPNAAGKAITLRRFVSPLPISPVDADRLQQVVWNLLSNAIKFTPRGGDVSITASQHDEHVQIEVRDTGIGIKPDFLPYVFDRFRQSDGTITRTHGGLGLGLSISRHLVEMHGGTITAASAGEGHGASFVVSLPVKQPSNLSVDGDGDADHLSRIAPASKTLPVLDRVRVLVVDDEPDSRRVVVRQLTRAHAEVREADSVADALAVLGQWHADILISDIAMPDEDGYSLVRRLRSSPTAEWRQLPAIALTAFVRSEDQAQAYEAGFQRHLPKPFEPAALLEAVAALTRVPASAV